MRERENKVREQIIMQLLCNVYSKYSEILHHAFMLFPYDAQVRAAASLTRGCCQKRMVPVLIGTV